MSRDVYPALRTERLMKSFGTVVAVDDVTLEARTGEFLGVLGPSGCGKTTLLRIIAGFERTDAGRVEIGGRLVADERRHEPPERRRVGMVFQEAALFPHMDVAANIGFGVREGARRSRVHEMVALVGLEGLERRMPHELSGGQQQRVALARALAPRPDIVLFDEPFSHLDAALRSRLRREVRQILLEAGATAVFVTHDQSEALEISDRAAVMRDGRIVQLAQPDELYLRPTNRFVARFVGEANLLAGVVRDSHVVTPIGVFRAPRGALTEGSRAEVLLRPEQVHLVPRARLRSDAGEVPLLRVIRRVFHGAEVHHVLSGPGGIVLEAATPSSAALPIGTDVVVHARVRDAPVYPIESGDDEPDRPDAPSAPSSTSIAPEETQVDGVPPGVG